ncbi:hypothetical protein FRB96_006875 [Tulasnella sp. 330]|nr:hypothetical protein FRB96_006875 [Tulasnella sp. 330]KAG8874101.1 hypothetical protein FRB97_006167 [Tulasnella sp. 331]
MAIPIPQQHPSAPAPFVPPVPLLSGIPLKTSASQPRASHPQFAQKPMPPVPGPSRPTAAGPAGYAIFPPKHHIQRSSASHVPVVPYPVRMPEHAHARVNSNAAKLPPRPMGHGRSGASAPMMPMQIPVAVQPPPPPPAPAQASSAPLQHTHPVPPFQVKEVNHPGHPSHLPRAPDLTGLGLFAPQTPAPPKKPEPQPQPQPGPQRPGFNQERSFGGRRATVSNCQPVTLQHDPLDQAEDELMQREHKRLEDLWDQEQEQQKREVEEVRQKYQEERMAAAAAARRRSEHEQEQQMRSQSPSRSRGKKSARNSIPRASDSPVMNEYGVPTPPATTRSPSNKAIKQKISAREDQERWRKEIDRVMFEQRRKQELARAEAERERLEAEEEKLRHETIKQYRHQQRHGHKVRAVEEQEDDRMFQGANIELRDERDQSSIANQPHQSRSPWGTRREQEAAAKRYARQRRRAQRDSGYLSSGSRSAQEVYSRPALQAPPNPNYLPTRPKRFYGEGSTGLREEGMQGPPSFDRYYQPEPVVREEWRIESGQETQDDQQVRKGRKMDEAARFAAASWELYEARWAALVTKPPKENSLRFIDIPWPSLVPLPPPSVAVALPPPTPLQISAILNPRAIAAFILSPHHSADKPTKTRLRAALLRFHPDKVQRWMSLINNMEQASVVMGVEIVVRCLNELMRKLEHSSS